MELYLDHEKEHLYVTLGIACFPEEDWVEVVDATLELWVPALTSFLTGHTDQCRLEFMDGPFEVRLLRKEETIIARFFQEGREAGPDHIPNQARLYHSLMRVIRQCRRIDHRNGKTPRFDREIAVLQQEKPKRQGDYHV